MKTIIAILTGLFFYSSITFSQGTFSAVYNLGGFKGITMTYDNNCVLFAQNGVGTIAQADTATGNFNWSAQINFRGIL